MVALLEWEPGRALLRRNANVRPSGATETPASELKRRLVQCALAITAPERVVAVIESAPEKTSEFRRVTVRVPSTCASERRRRVCVPCRTASLPVGVT